MTHYWIDKSEQTAAIFSKLIKKHFTHLKKAQMLYTLRDGEKHDKEGNIIVAEARKCGSKEREIWGPDFEINMDADLWAKANKADKYRIAYHELCHCGVDMEEGTNEVMTDDNGRLKTHIIKHDIFLTSFKNEIEIFGFDGADKDVALFMTEMMGDKEKLKKNKKKFLGEMGIEIYKETEETVKKKKKRPVEEDPDEDEDDLKRKKKKKLQTAIRMSTAPVKKTPEELEEEADKLLGIKKKKKDKFVEIDMKEHNRKKFGGKNKRV